MSEASLNPRVLCVDTDPAVVAELQTALQHTPSEQLSAEGSTDLHPGSGYALVVLGPNVEEDEGLTSGTPYVKLTRDDAPSTANLVFRYPLMDERCFAAGVRLLVSQSAMIAENVALRRERASMANRLAELQRTGNRELLHQLVEANARLAQLAITDPLTGLNTYRHFNERLHFEVERAIEHELPLSLLLINIDHLKRYNHSHGFAAGDELIRRLAQLLNHGRSANDFIARYGGDEFGAILVGTGKLVAAQVAERLRLRVCEQQDRAIAESPVSFSVGVASLPDDSTSAESLVHAADLALERAKQAGKNRVFLATVGRNDVPLGGKVGR